MNFVQRFKEIIKHIAKEDGTQNQFISDLDLLLAEIKAELKNIHYGHQKLKEQLVNMMFC